jgi:2-oxoglutarate dehydrogenase E1 component
MKDLQYITSQHPAFIENLYKDFLKNPESIDPDFKKFFEGFDFAIANAIQPVGGNGSAVSESIPATAPVETDQTGIDWKRELGVYRMILGYRNKGIKLALIGKENLEFTG